MFLPVTLATGAACVLLNLWLGWRISSLRHEFKVSVGDGGHEPLLRRMRAQANFIENAPFVLILLAGLELCGASRLGLALIAAIFILARIAHAIGMDGGSVAVWRRNGIMASSLMTLLLALWAIARVAAACLGR
jgi:uncharacterized membrane protein YecN with MAPEG domain